MTLSLHVWVSVCLYCVSVCAHVQVSLPMCVSPYVCITTTMHDTLRICMHTHVCVCVGGG